MSKQKRKIKLGRRVVEALDLPQETVSGRPKLTLQGRELILVENHTGIFACGESVVQSHTTCWLLRVAGEGLTLLELSAERLYVTGLLCSVEYER